MGKTTLFIQEFTDETWFRYSTREKLDKVLYLTLTGTTLVIQHLTGETRSLIQQLMPVSHKASDVYRMSFKA